MGNQCCKFCDNDPQNQSLLSTHQNTLEKKKSSRSNLTLTDVNQHQPKCDSRLEIKKVDRMQELNDNVKEMLKSIGSLEIDEKYLKDSFIQYPELGPYKIGGVTYLGQFKEGMRHGMGKMVKADGSIYEGIWINDNCDIFGRFIEPNGNIYVGEITEGEADGKGVLLRKDGSSYNGEWNMSMREGKGKEQWPDGSYYEGDFKASERHGKGIFVTKDGSKYEGDFVSNKKEGYGVEKSSFGNLYEGYWKSGRKHGHGKYTWITGAIYEGNYVNNLKEGFGKLTS